MQNPPSFPPPSWPPPRQERPTAGNVLIAWAVAWMATQVVSVAVLVATGNVDADAEIPTSVNGLLALAMWTAQMVAVAWWARRAMGTNLPIATGLRGRPRDLWWLVVGVASQFLLMPAVNWPLSRLFPDAFSDDEVSRRARDLVDAAEGAWFLVLVLVVVVGAPFVEEIVYRGMIQTGFVATFGRMAGVVLTAAMFAAIHLSPPEMPALFVFALVLGAVRLRTGRLGPVVAIHLAFNAAGMWAVAAS